MNTLSAAATAALLQQAQQQTYINRYLFLKRVALAKIAQSATTR